MEPKTTLFEPQPIAPVTFLALFTGRDVNELAVADGSVRAQSTTLGLIFLLSAVIHAAGVFAAMLVLFGNWAIALPLALLAGSLVFAAERMILAAHDEAKAEAACSKLSGERGSRFREIKVLIPASFRLAFAIVIAITVAEISAQFVYEPAILDRNAQRQQEDDADLFRVSEEQLKRKGAQLKSGVQNADRALKQAITIKDAAHASASRDVSLLDGEITRLTKRRENLFGVHEAQTTESKRQSQIAKCELNNLIQGCEGTSRVPGPGKNWQAAVDAENAARDAAAAALTEINAIETRLPELTRQREAAAKVDDQALEKAILAAEKRKQAAEILVANHDATIHTQIQEIVSQNQQRRVYDPDSLANRLWAFGALKRENEEFRLTIHKIKALVLAFELLPLLVILSVASSSFARQRGARIYSQKVAAQSMYEKGKIQNAGQTIAAKEAEARVDEAKRNHQDRVKKIEEEMQLDRLNTQRNLAQIADEKRINAAREGRERPVGLRPSSEPKSDGVIDVFGGKDDPCLKSMVDDLKRRIFFSSTVDASGAKTNYVLKQSFPQVPDPICNGGLHLSASGLALVYQCGCIDYAASEDRTFTTLHPRRDGSYLTAQARVLTDDKNKPLTAGSGKGTLIRFASDDPVVPKERIRIALDPPSVGDVVYCMAQIQGIVTLAEGQVLKIIETPYGLKIRVDSQAGHGFCGSQLTGQDGAILGLGATIRLDMDDTGLLPTRAYGDSDFWMIGQDLRAHASKNLELSRELEFV